MPVANMYCSLSLLAAVAALLQISVASVIPESVRQDEEQERIVYGRAGSPGQFPYACALHYNDNFICTSSILSSRTMLTAAHCVVLEGSLQPAGLFYAICNQSRSAEEVRVEFEDVVAHPDYDDQRIRNDIALFRTKEDIPLSDGENGQNRVMSVSIARADTDPMEYNNATAMGWGNVTPIRLLPILPERIHYAEQRIVSNSQCSRFYGGSVEPEKLCGTGPNTFPNFPNMWSGICNGDSGGPLVHLSADKEPVQIGIASYINGIAGCGKGVPAVWTRVSSYNEWIISTAGDDSINSL